MMGYDVNMHDAKNTFFIIGWMSSKKEKMTREQYE